MVRAAALTHAGPARALLCGRAELQGRVDRAEAALRSMGFGDVRVRHAGDTARIEVPLADLPRAIELADRLVGELKGVGYRRVTLDLEGLRSGNLNDALAVDGGRR